MLVGVDTDEHGERLHLVGEYGPYATASIPFTRMVAWPGLVADLRAAVLNELLLTSRLDLERFGHHDGGTGPT